MFRLKKILMFIAAAAAAQFVAYMLLSIPGYTAIYNAVLSESVRAADMSSGDDSVYDGVYKNCKNDLIFLCGEYPGVSSNYDSALMNIRYLLKKYSLKYIVLEVSRSAGELLNRCVDNKDYTLLSKVLGGYGGTEFGSREFYSFVAKVAEINDGLPEGSKLRFVGIDAETDKELARTYIGLMNEDAKGRTVPDKIKGDIFNADAGDDEYFVKLLSSINENKALYKALLLNNFFSYSAVVNNYFSDHSSKDARDRVKAENFGSVINYNRRAKYYCQAGDTAFADYLTEEYPDIKPKLYETDILYSGCLSSAGSPAPEYGYDKIDISETAGGGNVLIYDNRLMKYFEAYRSFIYTLNGESRSYKGYDAGIGDYFTVIAGSGKTTSLTAGNTGTR